ncbi:hypothetical protein BJV82DRAFT_573727 [Fennellomyces sp. T-0311]|nr:hypothetical protein BJV82DRAFT_573727 [Fennellomyces sp. T-0311]
MYTVRSTNLSLDVDGIPDLQRAFSFHVFDKGMRIEHMPPINDRFAYPLEIDLEPYLNRGNSSSEPHTYQLQAPTCAADKWFKFHDDRVHPVREQDVLEGFYDGHRLENLTMNRESTVHTCFHTSKSHDDKKCCQMFLKQIFLQKLICIDASIQAGSKLELFDLKHSSVNNSALSLVDISKPASNQKIKVLRWGMAMSLSKGVKL